MLTAVVRHGAGLLPLVILAELAVFAQESNAPKPKFEAASVRPSAPGVNRTDVRVSPSTMIYTGVTLKLMIRSAWRAQELQIVGGPSWINTARFDIAAKLDKPHPPQEMAAMLQDLLEDRFHLVVVPENRVQPHYSLVTSASKDGSHPGLKRTGEDECSQEDIALVRPSKSDPKMHCGGPQTTVAANSAHFTAVGVPMSQFALILTGVTNSWVDNDTGLDEYYDIKFSWPIPVGGDPGSEGVAPDATFISGALQNELGLKLEPVKGPVPVFVVQRAEMPTEN